MTNGTFEFPAEHREFLNAFQALVRKYPSAAAQFELAYVGPDAGEQIIRSGRPPDRDCVGTEWGLICKPIEAQL